MNTGDVVRRVWVLAVGAAVVMAGVTVSCKPREPAAAPAGTAVPAVIEVRDAMTNAGAVAAEGGRFKVLIVDEDGAVGLTRIGERSFAVPGTRKGDVAVIEITRIGADSAEATLVERLASGHPLPEVAPAEETPVVESLVGQLFRVEIPELNKDGQGVVALRGKSIVVPDVQVGERVEFRVVEETADGAVAEVVERLEAPVVAKPAADEEEIDYSKAVPKKRAAPVEPASNP